MTQRSLRRAGRLYTFSAAIAAVIYVIGHAAP
jgi:hypothetical protein